MCGFAISGDEMIESMNSPSSCFRRKRSPTGDPWGVWCPATRSP